MRLLLFEDKNAEEYSSNFTHVINVLPTKIILDTTTSYIEARSLYTNYVYDIVFIDFVCYEGGKLLSFIIDANPSQRIITVSDIHECTLKYGDRLCLENYSKERLLRPIVHKDIIKILTGKSFIDNKYANDLLLLELRQIEKTITFSYSSFEFDVEKLRFINTGERTYQSDFFLIVEKLNEYDIQYSSEQNGDIRIIT